MVDIKDVIRKHGLKATPNRVAVLEYLLNSKEHPSAEMVKEYLNSLGNKFSLATIYNILESFVEKGVIMQIRDDNSNMMRFDANTSFHLHVYNIKTNEISDYYDEKYCKRIENDLKDIRDINEFNDDEKIIVEM